MKNIRHFSNERQAHLASIIFFLLLSIITFGQIVIIGCSPTKPKLPVKPNEHMEIGWTPREVFKSPAYAWFDSVYKEYEPKIDLLEPIQKIRDSLEVIIIYGTWCGDSKREVPRFLKILDQINFPPKQLTLFAVDRTIKYPPSLSIDYKIEKVATFIIKYRGVEVGRIVESPIISLEQDLFEILIPFLDE